MLDFLRRRKRNWVITFFLGIIIVVFVLFYGGSQYQPSSFQAVAEVNGEAITQEEFALHYQRALERYRELMQGSLTPEMIKNLNLKGALLEDLIQKRLALQEARNLGLRISDEELVNTIAQIPEFQVNGRFNKERYLQLLRANRITPGQFEQEQREQLTMRRLYTLILDSIRVTEAEVRNRYRIEQEQINLQFIRLPLKQFLSEVKLTEEEVSQFYERNKEALKEPVRIRVEYLAYPFESFVSAIRVNDKEIEDYYQAHRETKYHTPKQAKLRYIIVGVEPGATAKQKAEARARADGVLQEARAGKDFALLAKQHSADPSSAQGGDIGWVAQGQLPPPVDQQIFSLTKGEISDVIENPGGFQIIKVEDLREERTQTLKEATPAITQALKLEKAKHEAVNAADRDREKALGEGDFTKLATERGLSPRVTGWFSTGELLPEIGPEQRFYETAFALKPTEVSPVVQGNNAYYLLRLKERQEAAVPPLDSVRPEIERRLTDVKARELLSQKANSLLQQLRTEKDIARLGAQTKVKVEETGYFARNAPELPKIGELPELTANVFALSAHNPFPDRIFTQQDSAFILAFKGSQAADMEWFEKDKDALMKQTLAEKHQHVLEAFMENLKAKASIQVNAAVLEEA